MRLVWAGAALLMATGCSAMKSQHVDYAASAVPQGLQYALPKSLLRIELVERDGELRLDLTQPFPVGDPNAVYMLKASSGAVANQEYVVTVDSQTRLLTYVNSLSEGKAGDIMTNLAKAAGAQTGMRMGPLAEAGRRLAGVDYVVYSRVFDPMTFPGCHFGTQCNLKPLSDEVRQRALEYMGCGDPKQRPPFEDMCTRVEREVNYFQLSLDPLFSLNSPPTPGFGRSNKDCNKAICYRAPAPYRINLRVMGVTDISQVVQLANDAPVMSLDLPAGMFARAQAAVELRNGMPTKVAVVKENEILAVTAVPLNLIDAFFKSVSQVVSLRIGYNNDQVKMAESDATTDAKLDDLFAQVEARAADRRAKDSNYSLVPDSRGATIPALGDISGLTIPPGGANATAESAPVNGPPKPPSPQNDPNAKPPAEPPATPAAPTAAQPQALVGGSASIARPTDEVNMFRVPLLERAQATPPPAK